LEALTKFNINLPGGIALDIGSAPGGWTNVLVERGYTVYAVDPANLHPSLMNDPRIKHYKCRAEQLTFENHFDIIVDDMNMDTDLTAQIMVDLSRCLKTGAFVIVTFKLPGHPDHGIEKGLKILTKEYEVIGVKSLFHNRQEVTVVARKE
jgi:23S rRNA (cytidine2498-2'-O)-methyltransferase